MIQNNVDGQPVSQAFEDAMAEPSVSYSMRLYRGGSDLGAVIKRARLDLGAGGEDGGTFSPASVYGTQFEATLADVPSSILGDELEVRVGVDVGGSYEYVAVAWVTVVEETAWRGVSDVCAVGRMGLMHAPHGLSAGEYAPSAIAAAIQAATGVSVAVGAFQQVQDVTVAEGGTCRDAIASMCARLGGFACELDGGIAVLPYSSTATAVLPAGHVTGQPELGALYEVDGIEVAASSGTFQQGTGRCRIEDAGATAATAAVTWGNISGYSFTPAKLDVALVDPRWTPADVLSLSIAGGSYSIPARGISITYDGGYFGTLGAVGMPAEAEQATVKGAVEKKADAAAALAQEAQDAATATNQHFWHRATDPSSDGAGTGAFVTDTEQDDFLAHVNDSSETRPLHNLLMNAEGILLRAAKKIRAAFTPSGVAFYDGQGNAASNITAVFSSNGAQVGKDGDSHLELDYHSMQLLDKEGNTYFHVSDLRGADGTLMLEESFAGDGNTRTFTLSLPSTGTDYIVEVDGVAITSGVSVIGTSLMFVTAPQEGAVIAISYYTASRLAKAYTVGTRASGSIVAPMSFAEGSNNIASKTASHAEGSGNIASGSYSHAEGLKTEASGTAAHAEGGNFSGSIQIFPRTTASGNYSHAEGLGTVASNFGSHAEGQGSQASGRYSHAQNSNTIAAGDNQTALGKYNVEDSNDEYALIIGNGTSNTARSNALTVDWSGNAWCAGNVEDGSGNILSEKADAADLATVATTGDYSDLTGIPTIDTAIDAASSNAVENSAIAAALDDKADADLSNVTGTLPVSHGGTGATTAAAARQNLNAAAVSNQSTQNVIFGAGSGNAQVQTIGFDVANSSHALSGKRLLLILRSDGISLYNSTDSSYLWQSYVDTASVTPSNATATNFNLRKQLDTVKLSIYQLKVDAELANGGSVSLGSNLIPSAYRPANITYVPLMANVSGKGAGVFLYIATNGTVTLFNRSGSALATGTNLGGNATWIV